MALTLLPTAASILVAFLVINILVGFRHFFLDFENIYNCGLYFIVTIIVGNVIMLLCALLVEKLRITKPTKAVQSIAFRC